MLRRREGAAPVLDPIDQELLDGVDAEFRWHVLVTSASCSPQEAEQRLRRMLSTGALEGTAGDTRPASQTSLAPVAAPAAPAPVQRLATPSAPTAAQALLRQLQASRGGVRAPSAEVVRASIPAVAPKTPSAASNPMTVQSLPTGGAMSSSPHAVAAGESKLQALIDEFAQGQGIQRWSAARLREALQEELADHCVQAMTILQSVLSQMDDPRIRAERTRLQLKGQRGTSRVYRSRAMEAEQASQKKEAAELWRKALDAAPEDVEAALHAAKNYLDSGDLKQAAHFARRAVQLAPENASAHRLLLRFFQQTGMDASAQRERDILAKLQKT